MRVKRKFFNRNTITVARELLGNYLVRKVKGRLIRARIIETEAYCGPEDKACHASRGLTPRTKIMFGEAGHAYVYMIYGMYHCLNIVTGEEGYPAAVLIRGVGIMNYESGIKVKKKKSPVLNTNSIIHLNGPGKLCRELSIDRKLNGEDIGTSKELWIESGEKIMPGQIKKGKRIGIEYAGHYKDKLWRFWIDL